MARRRRTTENENGRDYGKLIRSGVYVSLRVHDAADESGKAEAGEARDAATQEVRNPRGESGP
jgi:hypothetical protein